MPHSEPVSVIITCYNIERYVGRAIESVLAQDYAGQVEIILVDDGSTDGSLDVARNYDRVRLLPVAQNGGVLNAMLTGIRHASHDIVMLMDGDDTWTPDKVRETVRAFAADSATALVTHDLRYIDCDGNAIDRPSRVGSKFRDVPTFNESAELIDGILRHRDYVWLGSALSFRRSRCDIDGFLEFCDALPDRSNTYQDWPLAFWISSMPNARLALVRKVLLNYRVHGLNHSGDSSTLAKALRNVRRALNTALAIRSIAERRQLAREVQKRSAQLVDYYTFVFRSYSGQGMRAIGPFLRAAPFLLSDGRFAKEFLRLLPYLVLPPTGALRIINGVRRLTQPR